MPNRPQLPPFLFLRNGVYYFRRKIPAALRTHFDTDEVRKSLHTRDLEEARRLARTEAQRLDEQFASLRAQERAERLAAPRTLELDPEAESFFPALFQRWNERAPRPRTTVYDFAKASRRFAALHPGVALEAVDVRHIEALKQSLEAEGLSAGTVRKQLGAIAAMLQVAVEDGLLATNPARAVRIEAPSGGRRPRTGFTSEELAAIFSSPVYAAGDRPVAGAGAAAYWLPLLALYTGARQGEIGMLRVEDVDETGAIRFLRMGEPEQRPVPIHTDLIRLGFLQFVEMQRRAGQTLLFPDLRTDNKGKRTGNWSKWFARYLRTTVGIRDRRKSFDSFRHTFYEACRKAGVNEITLNQLMGRRTRKSATQPVSLEDLAAAMERLRFFLEKPD